VVSRIQEQLADTLRAFNVATRGFYDSFEQTRRGTIVLQVSAKVDEVWVPNEQIRGNLITLGIDRVRVVGQPSLESWLRLSQKTVSQEIYLRQGIGQHQKVIVFAGQYGDGYKEVVQSFLAQANKETLADENLTVVVSPHPRTSGELERKLIDNIDNDRLLLAVADLTTAELAAIASVVITWTSTVGVQAAFMGKPVIYYSPKSDGFRNDLIENDIAKKATPDTFPRVLRETFLDRINGAAMRNRLKLMGYGIDASDAIAEEICKVMPGQE
jgi:UDP-N-acetylglucosamine 2-epimerase